ncbi:MAG: hypothetical protein DI565_06365 [Ancylobacter novellus]|uniref:Uncharacterized protein n=1 Tax=Ancylobacter novellus TaxID=921 RepID=A0A2W5MB23_ANCNO|nr:MAG: hypothetical protein DI565_06365 [Ancylobacter novellus]
MIFERRPVLRAAFVVCGLNGGRLRRQASPPMQSEPSRTLVAPDKSRRRFLPFLLFAVRTCGRAKAMWRFRS